MRKIAEALEAGNETVDIFFNAIRAQKVMGHFLYLALKEGDAMSPDDCEGISWMLDQQAELLEDIFESVTTKQELIDEYHQRQEEQDAAADRDSEKVLGLRRQLIADAMGKGAELSEIAAAVNMRKANVEKVMRQLQGERPVTQAKVVNG